MAGGKNRDKRAAEGGGPLPAILWIAIISIRHRAPSKRASGEMQHFENIDKLHTTEMGAERIKRNCQLETDDVIQWSKARILDITAKIEGTGKNWYVIVGNYKITVNAHSYPIIAAHKIN